MRVLAAILIAVALTTARAQTPCGVAGDPPAPWYVEDGAGNPRPCPSDPPPPTPLPLPTAGPVELTPRQILIPLFKEGG